MSEPLTTGIKRIIWIASDKKHRIVDVWWRNGFITTAAEFREYNERNGYYITKHEVWL